MNPEMMRIKDFNEGEIPSNGYLLFKATTDNSRKRLSDVKDVISVISRLDADAWPKDSEWDLLLPGWFLDKIKSYSAKEISKNSHCCGITDHGLML